MQYNVSCFLIPLNCCAFPKWSKASIFSKMSAIWGCPVTTIKMYFSCGKNSKRTLFFLVIIFSNQSTQHQICIQLIYHEIEMKKHSKKAGWVLPLKVPSWNMHIHEFRVKLLHRMRQNIYWGFPIQNINLGAKLQEPLLNWCTCTSVHA